MPTQLRRRMDPILTAEELLDLERPAAKDAVKEARRKARRLKERARRRHRMRLVDDIIERLLGHRSLRPSKRLQEQVAVLSEGGHMFVGADGQPLTRRIKQQEIAPTVDWLESISGLDLHGKNSREDGLPSHWLGSTGRKADSGDLDLMVDEQKTTKDQLIQKLNQWVSKQKSQTGVTQYVRKSGINVHFLTPIKGNPKNGYVQTDFMFVSNPEWSQFVLQAPRVSAYKGADRVQLINSMAKVLGYKMNQSEGIKDRATDRIITSNPDKVAKMLLNPKATRADLSSVETMLKALKNDPKREEKLATFKGYLSSVGRTLE